jgi:hypothetical protein
MASPWFKFPLRYLQSPYFGNPKYDKVYIWLASEVSKSEHPVVDGNREVFLRPGQIVIGRHRAATSLGLSEKVYRNRIETLEKGQLLDRKEASRGTIITLICPDTYEWQQGIYNRKGARIYSENGPRKGQQRATTLETTLDQKKNNAGAWAGAYACGEEKGMDADEVGPTSAELNDAAFSEFKDKILEAWSRERKAVGLVSVSTPVNTRAAVYAAAMMIRGEWTMEIVEAAIKTLMTFPEERRNYTLRGLIENLELWANGGPVRMQRNGDAKRGGKQQPDAPADWSAQAEKRMEEALGPL